MQLHLQMRRPHATLEVLRPDEVAAIALCAAQEEVGPGRWAKPRGDTGSQRRPGRWPSRFSSVVLLVFGSHELILHFIH